jgi:hypothetical protein
MKNPITVVKNQLSEVKGRTLLLVIIGVIALIIAIFFIFRSNENQIISGGSSGKVNTIRAPNIESTPGVGNVKDQAYIDLQRQANVQHAREAIEKGQSSVATVTGDQFVNELSIPEPGLAGIGGRTQTATDSKAEEQAALAEYQKIYQEQLQREKQQEMMRLKEEELRQQEVYQEAYEGLMQTQAKSLLSQWQPPTQTYVKIDEPKIESGRGGAGFGGEFGGGAAPIYKAGDIIFGIMETSVNSDEPGPVMAKIVSGPLTGSKLIGSFKRVEDQVFLEFSLLNAPEMNQSVPLKAVAIDPETARTALATSVDHHRLLRYSSLFASSFLQGVGEAVLAGIQPNLTTTDTSITVSNATVTTKDEILVGLGEVGTKLGEKLDPLFDKPPTVTLDSGTAIGLLFLQDFTMQPGKAETAAPQSVQVVYEDANGNRTAAPSKTNASSSASSSAGQVPTTVNTK